LVRPSSPCGLCRTRIAFSRMAAPREAEGEAWWTGRSDLTINRPLRAASCSRSAQVAQLVEHATENRSVGGSIPPLGTILVNCINMLGWRSSTPILPWPIRGIILGNRRPVCASARRLCIELPAIRNDGVTGSSPAANGDCLIDGCIKAFGVRDGRGWGSFGHAIDAPS
jgi:hypothetical protein